MPVSTSYVLKSKNSFSDGRFEYRPNEGGTATLLRCEVNERELHVPSTANGRPVTAIGAMAFSGHTGIESIEVAPSVKVIGRRAFEGCSNLRELILPDALRRLPEQLFNGCSSLERIFTPLTAQLAELAGDERVIALGRGMRRIAPSALEPVDVDRLVIDEENPELKSDGIALYTKDGKHLIMRVVKSPRYAICEGCETVVEKAFMSDETLTEIDLPATLKTIEPFAFSKTGLVSVNVPGSVENIGDKAFYFCRDLTAVELGDGVGRIGRETFSHTALDSIHIPSSVTGIGNGAFRNTRIDFDGAHRGFSIDVDDRRIVCDDKGGLYRIGESGATLLELLGNPEAYTVRPGTTRIAPYAFRFHDGLKRVELPDGLRVIGRMAFKGCRQLAQADLPDTVAEIGAEAFLGTALEEFRIPGALEQLGERALLVAGENPPLCPPQLKRLAVAPRNARFHLVDGMLCERMPEGDERLICSVSESPVVRIPAAVTRLADYAFCNAATIHELYLHRGILSIGFRALDLLNPPERIGFEFAEPADGLDAIVLPFPTYDRAARVIVRMIVNEDYHEGLRFLFDTYDDCVLRAPDIAQRADIILYRLANPFQLSERMKERYRSCIERHLREICCRYAECDDVDKLTALIDLGFVDGTNIEDTIEAIGAIEETFSVGFLLDIKHARFDVGAQGRMDDLEL